MEEKPRVISLPRVELGNQEGLNIQQVFWIALEIWKPVLNIGPVTKSIGYWGSLIQLLFIVGKLVNVMILTVTLSYLLIFSSKRSDLFRKRIMLTLAKALLLTITSKMLSDSVKRFVRRSFKEPVTSSLTYNIQKRRQYKVTR